MNQASHMLGIQSLAFFHKKLLFFRKNLKIDNFLFSIKHKTTQNKELKYRRKNIVWKAFERANKDQPTNHSFPFSFSFSFAHPQIF